MSFLFYYNCKVNCFSLQTKRKAYVEWESTYSFLGVNIFLIVLIIISLISICITAWQKEKGIKSEVKNWYLLLLFCSSFLVNSNLNVFSGTKCHFVTKQCRRNRSIKRSPRGSIGILINWYSNGNLLPSTLDKVSCFSVRILV